MMNIKYLFSNKLLSTVDDIIDDVVIIIIDDVIKLLQEIPILHSLGLKFFCF